jgi:hypothetical protein
VSDLIARNRISGRIRTKRSDALASLKRNSPSTTASSISSEENLNHSQAQASRRRSTSCSSDAVAGLSPILYRPNGVSGVQRSIANDYADLSAVALAEVDTPRRRNPDRPTRRRVDTSLPSHLLHQCIQRCRSPSSAPDQHRFRFCDR